MKPNRSCYEAPDTAGTALWGREGRRTDRWIAAPDHLRVVVAIHYYEVQIYIYIYDVASNLLQVALILVGRYEMVLAQPPIEMCIAEYVLRNLYCGESRIQDFMQYKLTKHSQIFFWILFILVKSVQWNQLRNLEDLWTFQVFYVNLYLCLSRRRSRSHRFFPGNFLDPLNLPQSK